MKVDFIDDAKAPPAPKPLSKSAQESLNILRQLQTKPGKTARITLDAKQSVAGVKRSLGRIASTNKIKIESWDVDGVVYVKVVGTTDADAAPAEDGAEESTEETTQEGE